MTGRAIPVETHEVTAEWLTGVLRRHHPDVEVTHVEVVAAHSGTTGRLRVRVDAAPDGAVPGTLFVKLAPFNPRQRAFLRATGIGVNETRLYATVGDELPVRVPRVWHAEWTDGGTFVMVLEDLEASGCTFPRPADGDAAERATSTVEELALLHARFWESDRFAGDLAWVPERAGFGDRDPHDPATLRSAGTFVRQALVKFGDEMPEAFTEVGTLYAEHTGEVLDLWDRGERTLVHGDAHSGNLFTDRGRTGFYDWAMVSRSPGVRDVAYYLCNSVPTDVRREIEHDLLDRYCAVLAASGVTLDRDEAFEQYRRLSVYSWVSATSTAAMGSRWQPEAIGRAGMARATAAVADLDAAGALRDGLR